MYRSVLCLWFEEVSVETLLNFQDFRLEMYAFVMRCDNFRFADDIELMTGNRPGLYWLICWKYLSPLAMLSILIASFVEIFFEGSGYPAWVASKGVTERHEWPVWALVLISILILTSVLWIPAVAICRLALILMLPVKKSCILFYAHLKLNSR